MTNGEEGGYVIDPVLGGCGGLGVQALHTKPSGPATTGEATKIQRGLETSLNTKEVVSA